jgi:hypothetical protein
MNDGTHLTRMQYLKMYYPFMVEERDGQLCVPVHEGEKVNDVLAIVRKATQPWEDANGTATVKANKGIQWQL